MRQSNGRSILGIAVLIALPTTGWAETLHQWKKQTLEERFFCEGAYAGDINGDGNVDLVSGPFWYEGPSFEKKHEIYAPQPVDKNGYSKNFLAFTGDIDKDGWLDVIVVGFPGQESWWFQNPQGKEEHWPRHVIDTFVGNESPAYTDINGDGVADLIYINKQGAYGYAYPDPADPTKKWIWTAISPLGDRHHFTHGMGVGDVNGDGRLDLLEKGGWWEQPPKGQTGFWTLHPYTFAGPGGAQMFAYDVDDDGDNDVITSLQAHAYGIAWYEQVEGADGGIDFKQHIVLNDKPEPNEYGVVFSQPHSMTLVDIDQDGVLDVVTGKRHWAHNGHDPDARGKAVVYWFRIVRGPTGVEFVPYLIDDNSGVGTQVEAIDVTGDGLLDIVVGNKMGTFIHIHQTKEVSPAEWKEAQPKKTDAPKADQKSPAANDRAGTLPKGPDGKDLDLGFESGDLGAWTIESGIAFVKQPIEGDSVARRRSDMTSGHAGKHWLGTFEVMGDGPQGVLTSKPFLVDAPFASFLVGGGGGPEVAVELVNADTNKTFFRTSGENDERMKPVLVDLSQVQGKKILLKIVDGSSGPWGHINFDDFRLHATKPDLPIATSRMPDEYPLAGAPADEAVRAMTFPDGFRVDVLAAEPDLVRPIAMTIDHRGRIWVAEAYEYPIRAPEGKGRDRILIFADANGDGQFESRTVFAEGLNLVSGLEVGFGGVFVGAAPYLLFIPDANGDDQPDGPAQVLLEGWGYQDTHETLNAFNWGPDGWLYGCHGVFTHSKVRRPDQPEETAVPINAGIWRYHPTKRVFEVFAHGTSNPWGVDFNDQGDCFLACCVIPHLFHVVQGARYFRQAGTHFNPYTFADIPTIAKHRHWVGGQPHAGNAYSDSAGGGHAHAGGMIYLGDAWPERYRNQLFMSNIHGARINQDQLEPAGSGYVGDRAPDLVLAHDRASQMLYLRVGPDGQVYVIDWYDVNQCHRTDPNVHDQTHGRMYRIGYGDRQPVTVDLSKKSDAELVVDQLHPNDWYVRTARRLLQERAVTKKLSPDARSALATIAFEHEDPTRRLRGLWGLHVTGGLSDSQIGKALADADPHVRGYAIQLAAESGEPSSEILAKLLRLASDDPSPIVRRFLASAAQRFQPASRLVLLPPLLSHSEDRGDHNLPLLYWYALEPLADHDQGLALAIAEQSAHPQLLEYMARRLILADPKTALPLVVQRLADTQESSAEHAMIAGITRALEGKRRWDMPKGWDALAIRLSSSGDAKLAEHVQALSVKFGSVSDMKILRALVLDRSADPRERRQAIQTLVDVQDKDLPETLHAVLSDPAVRLFAIRGLGAFANPQTPDQLIAVMDDLGLDERQQAINVLASRVPFAKRLLEFVGKGQIKSSQLSADVIRQLRNLNDPDIEGQIASVWGIARDVTKDKAAEIEKYKRIVQNTDGPAADPVLGRAVYVKSCATCHQLFGAGGTIGPDLTGSNRRDLDYVLQNVIDPSAVMAREYQPHVIITADGRVITGIVKEATDDAYTVVTAQESLVIPKDEIDEMTRSPKSMMPEDQWQQLSTDEVRGLVAYLASPAQTPIRATEETKSLLFNGRDLSHWRGDPKLWSVENGEIVGRSEGLKENAFLVSDLSVGDFKLRFQVKLTPDAGNSGVQFRSAQNESGLVEGYQADIGQGWWGKLYEEHGRGLVWDKSAESAVKVGAWNEYEIEAEGSTIKTKINGQPAVDIDDPEGARQGIIALQIHAGPAMEVRFRSLVLECKPSAQLADQRAGGE